MTKRPYESKYPLTWEYSASGALVPVRRPAVVSIDPSRDATEGAPMTAPTAAQMAQQQREAALRYAAIGLIAKKPDSRLGHDINAVLDDLQAERTHTEGLAELLAELTAVVHGECPSLLNEDSGGDAGLAIRIDAALAQPATGTDAKEKP